MPWMRALLVVAVLLCGTSASAATITFNSDPFAGSNAIATPGRQIVGTGTEVPFDLAQDVLSFDASVFGISEILFANSLTSALPSSGVNVIVVQDTGTPFLAGIAANAIAAQLTASTPGFFIYFNTTLGVARLVYSTDLSDNGADLAVLAQLTTLKDASGFAALPNITADNFAVHTTPEPGVLVLFGTALAGAALRRRRARA